MSLVTLLATMLIGMSAQAQDRTDDIDKIFRWANADSPGCVVAASRHGKVIFKRAYGLADLERNVPMSEQSAFDIGSLRKQFIAASILLLAEDGRLSLTDDVRKHLPELPNFGHKITVDHLLTHTSGLRDWTGLLPLAGKGAEVLPLILKQRGLNFAPGEEWSYSNSGFVLLKEIVVRVSGMSFSDFTGKRLFDPLGMRTATYCEDLRDVIKNRALAYEKKNGQWKTAILLDEERGGGGALLATAGDLLQWNDALANGRLGKHVSEKLAEPTKLNNGRSLKYCRGLMANAEDGIKVIWHSGGAAGYHSWLGRFPEQGLSIVVLCNSEAVPAGALAERIAKLFVPTFRSESKPPQEKATSIPIAELNLSDKTGLFFQEQTNEPLRLVATKSDLRIVAGPPLVALDKNRFRNSRPELFFHSQDQFELTYLSPDRLEMKSKEGKITKYRRAEKYAPTANELKAFTGRFESDEVGAVFCIEPKTDRLSVYLEHSPRTKIEFQPVDRDTFQIARVTIRFHRDKEGKVQSLDYSNPVIRKITFFRGK